ncbi:MAG: hypothetical protein TREMPRED_002727 [Tremellales sp. Tagirdzhanova-0007]|nr:MAG: hypothetical protein TREMPRED_002727 [Tremellales sp. Tagirdzhanova-0007]
MHHQVLLSAVLTLVSIVVHGAPTYDDSWFQPENSPATALFKKRYVPSPSDANFSSNYPPGWVTPPPSSLPASWTAKLASLTLPNVGVSMPNNGYPTYPNGESGADQNICSFTYQCTAPDDLLTPPDGVLALTFDDGPTDSSPTLYSFLETNNISSKATHFMIGSNILSSPEDMQTAATAGGHIAVHTWSHLYTTTLSNEAVLAELGWTMQIISDLNGGRLPKYWRPPYGDVDNRVRAIAKGVFGLTTVVWNQDTADWAIGTDPAYTISGVEATMDGWFKGPKSPGLCMLEHELNNNTVGVFMTEYPVMTENGWIVKSVPDAFGMPWYQNADGGNTGPVTSLAIGLGTLAITNATSSTSSSSSMNSVTSATATAAVTAIASKTPTKTGGSGRRSTLNSPKLLAVIGLVGAMLL